MVLLALLLVASASRITVVDEVFSLAPGEVKTVNLSLHQHPAVVDAAFKVTSGDSVVSLGLRGPDGSDGAASRRFLRVMHEQSAGALRYPARTLGDYQVLVENPRNHKRPATVALQVSLAFGEAGTLRPEMLSPQRRRAVVGLSLLFFAVVAWWSGRRLLAAIEKRKRDAQFPLF
jgi:hypothetical protein